MKSGLKYTQSFGKCSEQDTTFSHTCSQRAVGFGVRRQQRERGYPLQAAGANRTYAAFSIAPGRSAPVTGRPAPVRFSRSVQKVAALKNIKRSGTAENCSRETGCQAFVFGWMRSASRTKMGAFFIPCRPAACGF